MSGYSERDLNFELNLNELDKELMEIYRWALYTERTRKERERKMSEDLRKQFTGR